MSGIIAQNSGRHTGLMKAPSGGGTWTKISSVTASSSSSISFTSGIDSTYKEYVFTFNNIHPETDSVNFTFNMSTDSGSNYNVTKTTTAFIAEHKENNNTGFEYRTATDLAQSTSDQQLAYQIGNDNDQCFSGDLKIFNPSSDTFVKHFLSTGNKYTFNDASINTFIAGYGNTTSAVDGIRFQMSSGNIDVGDICLYGIA